MIEDVAARLAAIEDTIAELTAEAERLRSHLLGQFDAGTTITVAGQPRWRITPGRRTFNPKLAVTVLTAEQVLAATVPKLDPASVKQLVAPATYEACCTQGEPFLTRAKG